MFRVLPRNEFGFRAEVQPMQHIAGGIFGPRSYVQAAVADFTVRTDAQVKCWLDLKREVDESRNHSRRWCDMSACGNRLKARRHYQQSKAEQ